MKFSSGKIYLIPAALFNNEAYTLPEYAKKITRSLTEFIVERPKTARHYLKAVNPTINFNELKLHELNKRTRPEEMTAFLQTAEKGGSIGLLSEAGAPAVADPGANIVALAHQQNIRVVPLVGPSSILLALMASGMNGQNFIFHGYLPIQKPQRIKALKEIERQSKKANQTQIFIETPYRNMQLLEDILKNCQKNTRLCIAADITAPTEFIQTKTIYNWVGKLPGLHKRPAVWLLDAN